MSHPVDSTCSCGGTFSCYHCCADTNKHNSNNLTIKTASNCASLSNSQTSEQLRQDLARQLDRRITEFGGPIRASWDAIKQHVESEILTNLGDSVKADVENILQHPQLRELVKRLRYGRSNAETRTEVLDKMTATILPKVRRSHRQFLDDLNKQVSEMIVQFMHSDQLASVIDDERLLSHLFRLAASEDELSSQRT